MEKILFASDFSESCQNALDYLKSAVKHKNVIIDFIHVYDVSIGTLSSIKSTLAETLIAEREQDTTDRLNEQLAQLPDKQRGLAHAIYGMYPSNEIADLAKKTNAELIVMAMRQKYSMVDRLIGTVTAHTFAKSELPVLAIPNGATHQSIDNILLPFESENDTLSPNEITALNRLHAFSKICNHPKIHFMQLTQQLSDKALQHSKLEMGNLDLSNTTDMHDGLMRIMENNKIDLLSIYHKNRNFWETLYRSSNTRKVLFKTRMPLLIF